MKASIAALTGLLAGLSGLSGLSDAPLRSPAFLGPTSSRLSKGRKAGAYGRGLRNQITRQQHNKLPKVGVLRDEHGAYTLTGRDPRRMWLGGISAQRGF